MNSYTHLANKNPDLENDTFKLLYLIKAYWKHKQILMKLVQYIIS